MRESLFLKYEGNCVPYVFREIFERKCSAVIFEEKNLDTRIIRHLEMVLETNKITNLTSIRTYEEGMLLHIEDSLHGLSEMDKAPAGPYADIGTGGGFPGVPLAILTGRKTTLVDSVRKKTDFLDSVIKELNLSSYVETYWGRIEDLALERKEYYAVISARALTQLGSLLELSAPLLKIGGELICYKANASDEEVNLAVSLEKKLGMKLISRRSYYLSDNETPRCLFVFRKVSKPSLSLPRKVGFAQKKPLHP